MPKEKMLKDRLAVEPLKKVTLHNGLKANIEDVVLTQEGMYFLKDDQNIIFCDVIKRYYMKQNGQHYIASFKGDKIYETKLASRFAINTMADVWISRNERYRTKVESIPLDYFTEDLTTGIFYNNNIKENEKHRPLRVVYRKVKNAYYNPSGDLKFDYLMGLRSPTNRLSEGKQYRFGIELETMYGYLPIYVDNYLNYNAVHDGSLRVDGNEPVGAEYVSGILYGDMGFLQVKRLCNELTKRCKGGKLAGFHVHLGDINFSKENLVFTYILYKRLENEIFSLLPKSRSVNEYCRMLPILENLLNADKSIFDSLYDYNKFIENSYVTLFDFVGTNVKPSYNNNKFTEHPFGKKCGYRKESSRYCWLNFVPAVFNTRDDVHAKTIEIRNHSYTTNYRKVKNWILIHMGILWFVENCKEEIITNKKITLTDIMLKAYPKKSSFLINYIEERKALFSVNNQKLANEIELKDYEEIIDSPELTLKNLV